MLGLPRITILVGALALGSLLMLVFVIGLVRVVRGAVVRRLALAPETIFRVDGTGSFELSLEGPAGDRAPPLEFTLEDRARGAKVALAPVRSRARGRGVGAEPPRLALAIEHAGEYGLRVDGLGALADPAAYAVVLVRPVRWRLFFLNLGIVVGAWFFTFGTLSLVLGV